MWGDVFMFGMLSGVAISMGAQWFVVWADDRNDRKANNEGDNK